MYSGRQNDLAIVPTDSRILSRAKFGGGALLVILGITLVNLPAKGQLELLPQPRLAGQPFVDPNRSENVIPIVPKEDGPPPEQENDVAKLIHLYRDDPLFAAIADKEDVLGGELFRDEEKAYDKIFKHAQKFSADDLAKYSLKGPHNKGIIHADLVSEVRKDFLRELIRVEGRLIRIRALKPTDELAKDFSTLYEGWLLNNNNPEYTICVVFSELPEGVIPGDSLSYRVAVDGYYFKLRRYRSQERISEPGKKDRFQERYAPLILTRTIRIIDPPTEGWGLGDFFVPVVVGMILVLGGAIFGLVWWFRREDRQVQKMTEQALSKKNPFEEGTSPSTN